MISVKDANGDKFDGIDGTVKRLPLFREDEAERAETIANALSGMTIEAAQELLIKVNKYLLQIRLP